MSNWNESYIEDLVKRFELKKEFLLTELTPACNMFQVSQFLDDWQSFARGAGISEADIKAILYDGRDENDRRYKTLYKWHQINPYKATYSALIQILVTIKRVDLAQEVCKIQDSYFQGKEGITSI